MSEFRDRLKRKRDEYDRARQEQALAEERQRNEEARIRDEQVAGERRRLLAAKELQPIIAKTVREMARQTAPLLPEDSANTRLRKYQTVSEPDKSFLGSLLKRHLTREVPVISPGWILTKRPDTRVHKASIGTADDRSTIFGNVYDRYIKGLVLDQQGSILSYTADGYVHPAPTNELWRLGLATNNEIAPIDKITPETDGSGVQVDIAMWEQRFLDLIPDINGTKR